MTSSDEVVEALGGCGRYQVRLSVIVHLLKTLVCWSDVALIVIFKTPDFWCVDDIISGNMSEFRNSTLSVQMRQSCLNTNGSTCSRFWFDPSMDTMINKFNLVCDNNFIPSLIVSIQGVGMLVGNPLAGQLADLYGRRFPLVTGLFLMTSCHLVALFSVSWRMYAITRFFIGVGASFFLTVQYTLLSEFSPARWRAWIIGFPSWAIQSCVFVLVAWIAHNWVNIHLVIVVLGVMCLFSIFFVPESFRWLLLQNKYKHAQKTLGTVAKVNMRTLPDLEPLADNLRLGGSKTTKYTFIHLFKSKYLVKVTLLLALNWTALGFARQGLSFGIQALSGDVYINLLLFSASGIPGKAAASALQNRLGRRHVALIFYVVTAIGGVVAGILQYVDTPIRGSLTNGFAICANLGIHAAWGPVEAATVELYPTVIRNLGSGSLSTLARIGAIAGTQLVFLNLYVPGILFFVCGLISVACIIALIFLPESMNAGLADRIETTDEVGHDEKLV